jgi:hypothetical protein
VPLRKQAVELGAALAGALDLGVDLLQRHTSMNDGDGLDIPSPEPAKQVPGDDERADQSGGDRDPEERLVAHS